VSDRAVGRHGPTEQVEPWPSLAGQPIRCRQVRCWRPALDAQVVSLNAITQIGET
jgi:hypothetical protein